MILRNATIFNVPLFVLILPAWLLNKSVQKLVLVVKGVESRETLERWVFDCDCNVQSENLNTLKFDFIQFLISTEI